MLYVYIYMLFMCTTTFVFFSCYITSDGWVKTSVKLPISFCVARFIGGGKVAFLGEAGEEGARGGVPCRDCGRDDDPVHHRV